MRQLTMVLLGEPIFTLESNECEPNLHELQDSTPKSQMFQTFLDLKVRH